MIEKSLLSKTEADSIGDFNAVFDFETAFRHIVKDIAI
jgi:uncharacterized repeat protein (TIGR04138 family)